MNLVRGGAEKTLRPTDSCERIAPIEGSEQSLADGVADLTADSGDEAGVNFYSKRARYEQATPPLCSRKGSLSVETGGLKNQFLLPYYMMNGLTSTPAACHLLLCFG